MGKELFRRTILILTLVAVSNQASAAELRAVDFGLVGDGKKDDGPAILNMLSAARKLSDKPMSLVFPEDRNIYAATAHKGYLLPLEGMENITIEGNGSTFLLHPRIRMVDLCFARRVVLRNFKVDYTASMFVETTIHAVDANLGHVDVKLHDPSEADALGGPTKQDGEQWFGGFIWCENGRHSKAARHFSVKGVESLGDGVIRVFHGEGAFTRKIANTIIPGVTAFSVPRAGVAHRHGPGALFQIHDAADVKLEGIAVWGAPWFSFSIYRCEGFCQFLDVDVVPRPGGKRLMSGCRDAFHVTANRAKLLFDGCDTRGIGDDDYNFCVLSSTVRNVISPTEIVIRQKFPIQYNPMRVGETLSVMNSGNTVLGSARITGYSEMPLGNGDPVIPGGRCPQVKVTLDSPVAGLATGLTVWSKEAGNPDTTMRHCTASFSIRMQTSLKIDRCRFTCYTTSYGMSPKDERVEGPGPESIWITDSEFLTGRGAGYVANCGGEGPLVQTRFQKIHIEGCKFDSPLRIDKARSITLLDNDFEGEMNIDEYESLEMRGNRRLGQMIAPK